MLETPFDFNSTAMDVLEGVDLSGKRMIVTGGNGGVGRAVVEALAQAGAHVTLTSQTSSGARSVADDIRRTFPNAKIDVRELDLSSLPSVRKFVDDWDGPIDALVNNAGVMALPELQRTEEGREMQFATNFLGHFALTLGLKNALARAGGRIVSVGSTGSLFSAVIWDDPDFRFVPYDPLVAYGQSKTACILLAMALPDDWRGEGITCDALHPGAIATNLQQHTGNLKTPEPYRKSPEQGAATSVLLAASPRLVGVSGLYFEDCNEASVLTERPHGYLTGAAPFARDPENADRLWTMAKAMLQAAK